MYDSLLAHLSDLNINNVSVELFLSNEVRKCNNNSDIIGTDKGFTSDITITNIDMFETPTIKNGYSNKLFLIANANVVFDEFHEFISDSPIFALFINIMKIRNNYSNSNTLLLSASPCDISYLWDTVKYKTIVYPPKKHLNPIHDGKYLIRGIDNFIHDIKGSELIIFNSKKESQLLKSKLNNAYLYHSYFSDEYRNNMHKILFDLYGKKAEKKLDNIPFIATILVQASIDISVPTLYESVMSPEATIQRIGRVGRFGESDYDKYTITIFKQKTDNSNKDSSSEKCVNELFYDSILTNQWYDALKAYNNKYLTLKEIYEIYNQHVEKYSKKRKEFFTKKYNESQKRLSFIYPIKYNISLNVKSDIKTADSNKLRSVGTEIFYFTPTYNKNTLKLEDFNFSGPFSTKIYDSIEIDFDEDDKTKNKIIKAIKKISSSKDEKYQNIDYKNILEKEKKRKNFHLLSELKKMARKSNSP